jgi:dolichol-phosphate mannosyltransferase
MPPSCEPDPCGLSVVIPALNEEASIADLLTRVHKRLVGLGVPFEIIVVDGGSTDETSQRAADAGAAVVRQEGRGYAKALLTGFGAARGQYIITMDADYSHDPDFLEALWTRRHDAEVVIASRYLPGGHADMPWARTFLSRWLNRVGWGVLSIPVRDMTSGFRLYHRKVLGAFRPRAQRFDVLVELLTQLYCEGWRVLEVPFHYRRRQGGRSHVALLPFGLAYGRTLLRMWAMRNSLASADYDDRAFRSRIPVQRYWQRRRYAIVLDMLGHADRVLDVGCGSSKILEALPHAVGADINLKVLRFRSKTNRLLVNSDVRALPFKTAAFDAVICSEVLEHVSYAPNIFTELSRVLGEDGILIIGTPDYGRWQWRWIEWWYNRLIPGGHGQMHIEQYTEASLRRYLQQFGFEVLESDAICSAELILKCRKPHAG